ncbi:3022_t:CDS:2 [Dentiscutata heterogama]|uniref:3022_t:CDS:1 n=1 Tax=Dentiscutata heterogama TaxID=1316150 RepID=A0ACA9MJS2_9GLOM|nr:3022_t:CDS:2 [Dentiscutata heterogama]
MTFLQDQDGFSLFGLNDLKVKSVLENKHIATNSPPQCSVTKWKKNPSSDKETLLNLYNMGLLKTPLVDKNELVDGNESISHSIAQYIRIGYNLDSGEKIQEAIQDLSSTLVANLELCRDYVAPISGDLAGFIIGQMLSHISEWNLFSPAEITKLTDGIIHKPVTGVIVYTQPKNLWTIPILAENISALQDMVQEEELEFDEVPTISTIDK